HSRAARTRFDVPLVRQRVAGRAAPQVDEPRRRLPHGDLAYGGAHARAEVEFDRAAGSLLDLRRHEPRGDALPGRDCLPHLLGRARHLDLMLDGSIATHASSCWVPARGSGCANTISRYARPLAASAAWDRGPRPLPA